MFGSMGTASKEIGAGNAISCNDITFPQPKTLNTEAEKRKRLLLQGEDRLCKNEHKIDIFISIFLSFIYHGEAASSSTVSNQMR